MKLIQPFVINYNTENIPFSTEQNPSRKETHTDF